MATTVYNIEEIVLQNGDTVEVRSLNIKALRKFMDVVAKLNDLKEEDGVLGQVDILVEACSIALEKSAPELAKDREALENALDVPTMWKILDVAGGVKMGNQ